MVGIQLSLFGRTYPAHSLVIMDTIFKPCLKKSQKPIFQCLQVENGQAQEWFEGGAICAAWRLFDAQYWGVPQRRKRIYLVGSFGSDCAAEILFKPDSVRRYLTPSGAQRADAGRNSNAGAERSQFVFDGRGNGNGRVAPTMTGDHNNRITDYSAIVLQSFDFHGWNSVTAAGLELRKEQADTNRKEAGGRAYKNIRFPAWIQTGEYPPIRRKSDNYLQRYTSGVLQRRCGWCRYIQSDSHRRKGENTSCQTSRRRRTSVCGICH